MNQLRRRWAWLSYRLIGRRALLIAALLAVLITVFLLLSNNSDTRSREAQKAEKHATAKPPLPTKSSSPSPTSIPESKLKIPKRIHHFFENAVDIPAPLAQAVNSWANNHKDYNAYFWDSRYLESRLLPDLPLFKENKPCFQIERRTVSRLLLLISQGGLLADPELMSLHSIDSFLKGSYCVLAQEPPEAAVLLYGITNGSLPSLRFAACRPGHPFLRLLLKNFCRRALVLHGVNSSESKAQQKVTALALTAAFEAAVAAYDDTCSRRVCDHRDRIVLADASIFLPLSPSGGLRSRLLTVCQDNAAAGRGSKFELRACKQLRNPMREDGTRLVAASLAVPMTLSDREAAAARRIRLDSIGPNVGRAAVLNWLLPNAR